ncbi:MAG TPA: hypothetical protein VMW24_06375, partial [Sedimentisphaerales bacterium]|nr:hypothetical protein [Sedimentisphaerales bacterium]
NATTAPPAVSARRKLRRLIRQSESVFSFSISIAQITEIHRAIRFNPNLELMQDCQINHTANC